MLDDGAPDDPTGADDDAFATICLHCLIDMHPEVGRGLDVATQLGAARLVHGAWRPRGWWTDRASRRHAASEGLRP